MSKEPTKSTETLAGSWLLLAEIEHRVVNEYTQAIALLSTSAMLSKSTEAKTSLNGAAERLMNYAAVHRALQMERSSEPIDLSQYLRRLCEALAQARLSERGISITLIEHSIEMEAKRCWRVGLIVSELIMNTVRHAFAKEGGSITIALTTAQGQVQCWVSDDGRGSCDLRPGRGSYIVEAITGELGGRLTRARSNRGTTVMLTIPQPAGYESAGLADLTPLPVKLAG